MLLIVNIETSHGGITDPQYKSQAGLPPRSGRRIPVTFAVGLISLITYNSREQNHF